MKIEKYCVQCFRLICLLCPCVLDKHTTVSICDAFDNIRRETDGSIQELEVRIKQADSFIEDLTKSKRNFPAVIDEIKNVSANIQKDVTEVEETLQQQLPVELKECERKLTEVENAKSALTVAKENLVSVIEESDPILFLGNWKNPVSVWECYDQFNKDQLENSNYKHNLLNDSTDVREYFYNVLASCRYRTPVNDVDMEIDSEDTCSNKKQRINPLTIVGGINLNSDRFTTTSKFMLGVSECLPDIVKRMREKEGIRECVHLPRNMEKDRDDFMRNIEVAYNFIIELNNEKEQTTEKLIEKSFLMARWTDSETKERQEENRRHAEKIKSYEEKISELKQTKPNKSSWSVLNFSPDKTKSEWNEAEKKAEISTLQHCLEDKESTIDTMKKEKEDLQSRLSSLAGEQLTKNNPAITDLSDPNRPMKIGEKYGELYDNEWTDCMDLAVEVKTIFPDVDKKDHEDIVVHHLCRMLTECFRECKRESKLQLKAFGFIASDEELEENTNDEHKNEQNQIGLTKRDFNLKRRENADSFAEYLIEEKAVCNNALDNWDYHWKNEHLFTKLKETPFLNKCVQLCWYMVIQDPMMYLEEKLEKGSTFDKTLYKEFVQKGDRVKFLVWPALYLYKGGALIYKGVVQAYSPESESKS